MKTNRNMSSRFILMITLMTAMIIQPLAPIIGHAGMSNLPTINSETLLFETDDDKASLLADMTVDKSEVDASTNLEVGNDEVDTYDHDSDDEPNREAIEINTPERRHPDLTVEEALLADYLANDLQYLTHGGKASADDIYYDGLRIRFPDPSERALRKEEEAIRMLGFAPEYRDTPRLLDFLTLEGQLARNNPTFGGIRNNGEIRAMNGVTFGDWFEINIDGTWQIAFCINFPIQGPATNANATVEYNPFQNDRIRRALWFGYGGGSGNWPLTSNPQSNTVHANRILATTLVLTHINEGRSGAPSSSLAEVGTLWNHVISTTEIPTASVSINRGNGSHANLNVSVVGDIQRSENVQIQGYSGNEFRISVPSGIDLINESRSSGNVLNGGIATLSGGETVRFEAPMTSNTTLNTGQIRGSIREVSSLRVNTGAGIQDLGSIYVADSSGAFSLSVDFTPRYATAIAEKRSDSTGNAIPGTVFRLQRRNNDNTSWHTITGAQSITVDSTGNATFNHLTPGGRYRIQEVSVPEPYVLDDTWREFTAVYGTPTVLTFLNEQAVGEVVVTKFGESDVLIPGTRFRVTGNGINRTGTTNSQGQVVFGDLPLGASPIAYTIREEFVPAPYILDPTPMTVSLSRQSPTERVHRVNLTQTNDFARGRLRIEKIGEYIVGFEDYIQPHAMSEVDDNIQGLVPHGLNGMLNVLVQNESSNPPHLSGRPQVTPRQGIKWLFEEIPLAGVRFHIYARADILSPSGSTIYYANDFIDHFYTDEYGFTQSDTLYLGDYFIREVYAPNGWYINDLEIDFSLTFEDQYTSVVFDNIEVENEWMQVEINVLKFGEVFNGYYSVSDEHMPIGDIHFGLFAGQDFEFANGQVLDEGTLIKDGFTDSEGRLPFLTELPLGLFYVQELATSDFYVVDRALHFFEHTGDVQGSPIVEIEIGALDGLENNFRRGRFEIIKRSETESSVGSDVSISAEFPDAHGPFLAGVHFELWSMDTDEYVKTLITNEYGRASLDHLIFGSYRLQETKAAEDHLLMKDPIYFEIIEDDQALYFVINNYRIPEVTEVAEIGTEDSVEGDSIETGLPQTGFNAINSGLIGAGLFFIASGMVYYSKKKEN